MPSWNPEVRLRPSLTRNGWFDRLSTFNLEPGTRAKRASLRLTEGVEETPTHLPIVKNSVGTQACAKRRSCWMRQVRKEEWCRFLRTSYLRRAVWGSLSSAHGTRALPSSLTTLLTLGQKLFKAFHLIRFQNGLNPLPSFSSNDSMPLVGFLVDFTKLLATFL